MQGGALCGVCLQKSVSEKKRKRTSRGNDPERGVYMVEVWNNFYQTLRCVFHALMKDEMVGTGQNTKPQCCGRLPYHQSRRGANDGWTNTWLCLRCPCLINKRTAKFATCLGDPGWFFFCEEVEKTHRHMRSRFCSFMMKWS